MIFLFCFIYYNFYFCLDNDYYYGGSMRDLNNGHGRPRKASSVSHLGELIAWTISLIWSYFQNQLLRNMRCVIAFF